MVDMPTYSGGNILDPVLTDVPNKILQVEDLGKLGNSDHIILGVHIDTSLKQNSSGNTAWNYARANFVELKRKFSEKNWHELLVGNVESFWKIIKDILSQLCNKHIPKKSMRERNRPKWMKQELLRLIRQKKSLWKKYRQSQTAADFHRYKETKIKS